MSERMRGLILKETNTGEADKILTVLTESNGKISVLAKNIRRVKGRFGAGASFLCYSDFELDPSRTELYYLKRATPVENFFGISESIEALSLDTYMGQLASYIVPECFPTESSSLSLLLNTFYVLAHGKKDLKLVKSIFELRLMAEEGCAPQIAACEKCGEVKFPMCFSVRDGVVRCAECGGEGIMLNEALYKSMLYILGSDIKKLYNFTLGEENAESLYSIAERYALHQIGRDLPALDYLNSVII